MRGPSLALCALVGALFAREAHSSTCALSPIVFPRPGETAATNTHVFVRSIGIPPTALELHASATDTVVDVTAKKIERNEAWFELIPKAPLPPSTRYDVIEYRENKRRYLIDTFPTGVATDTTPPQWGGPLQVEYRVVAPIKQKGHVPGKPRVITLDMLDHQDYIAIVGPAPEDDVTPSASIRYAVWIGNEKDPIDFSKPPDVHKAEAMFVPDGAKRARFTLGSVYLCDACDVDIAGRGEKPFKIGVKPYDLAGNYGAPVELVVDFKKPVPAR